MNVAKFAMTMIAFSTIAGILLLVLIVVAILKFITSGAC